MNLLEKEAHTYLYERYLHYTPFFPIIGAVLEGTQDGIILANTSKNPQAFFIIHHFGFAQYIEFKHDIIFSKALCNSLIKKTLPNIGSIIRCYNIDASWQEALRGKPHIQFAQRIQFYFEGMPERNNMARAITANDMDKLQPFGIDAPSRFWGNKQKFLKNSLAQIAIYEAKPVSICYAAAISGNKAEIDIATHPDYYNKSYATRAAKAFIAKCLQCKLQPHWDCYHNNTASVGLAQKLGFKKSYNYDYAIIRIQGSL